MKRAFPLLLIVSTLALIPHAFAAGSKILTNHLGYETHGPKHAVILAKAGDKAQPVATLFAQEDGRGQKVTAREGRFTDLRVELVRRFRVEDRFVRGIQCRKRPRGIRRLQVPIP